jgi:DNA-binding NtrC family response regulator
MDKPIVLVGVSAATRNIEEEIRYAAQSDTHVLVTGEPGVGKETVARAIHQGSRRAPNALVTINCGSFPEPVLAADLFGQPGEQRDDERARQTGWFEVANGGTIFMDGVSELSARLQRQIERFLQTGEISRAANETTTVNVRVIAAAPPNLYERIEAGTFRQDLYYHLNVVHIEVPPLRERHGDVEPLVHHFLRVFGALHRVPPRGVSADAMLGFLNYAWPGNIRELRNVVERLVLHARGQTIDVEELPPAIRAAALAPYTEVLTSGGVQAEMFDGGDRPEFLTRRLRRVYHSQFD